MFSTRRVPRAACRSRRAVEQLESRVMLAVTPVPMGNPSFEQVAGADNEPVGVAIWEVNGQVGNAFNPNSTAYTNASDDGPTGGALAAPGDGKQVLFINGVGSASQTLTNALAQPGTVYELTVAIGNRSDLTMGGVRIALFAGDVEIASATADGEDDAPSGGFANLTATSGIIDVESPAANQPIMIVLSNTTAPGGPPLQVNFDDVRLSAVTDTTAPTISVTPPVVEEGDAFTDFGVLFADDLSGVDTESINAEDVTVTGPGGPLAVSLQGVSGTFGGPTATATFRVAAPGGTWGPEDNGGYTMTLPGGAVFDLRGNRTAPLTNTFDVDIEPPDTTAPTAAFSPGTPPADGAPTYQFTVTYADDVDVLVSSGNSGQITVSGPGGFSQAATLVGTDSDTGSSVTLRYQITAPGGTFDPADNGTYTVATSGQTRVTDVAGNPVAEGTLGTFDVSLGVGMLPGPTALFNRQQPGPEFGAATYDFTVQYSDDEGVNASTVDGGDVVVIGPTPFSAAASLVSGNLQNGTSVEVTYRITAPGGTWDPSDNGTYNIGLLPNAVADVDGDFADAGNIEGAFFTVNFPTPVVGGLDLTFGNGTGVSTFDPPGPALKANDVIGFDDGSSVAVSFTVAPLGSANVTLFRTLPSGQLDPSFGGSNNGLVSLDVGGEDRASTVVRLADGKFLVAGTTRTYSGATETDADFFVARFNANGTVDATFGGNNSGFGVADFGPTSFDRGNDLIVLEDGRIMVFGQSTVNDPDGDFALARFSAGGVFDTTFGSNGRVVTDLGATETVNAVTLAADGGFVAAGSTKSGNTGSFAVVRYNADGSLFNAWGPNGNGSLLVDFLPGLDEAQSIVSAGDGKMVAGGLATTGDPDDATFDSDFAVIQIDNTGNLDPTFGSGGKVLTDFGDLASINKLILQPGGKVVASGQVISTLGAVGTTELRVAVARYNADGSLDATFSDDGKLVIDFSSVDDGGASLVAPVTAAAAAADFDTGVAAAADEPLSDLEAKFEQFRAESQGLVAITKGGGILALATQGNLVAIARVIGDGGAPSLFVALIPSITEIDVTSSTFTVRYVDDLAVDVARLGTGDIRVTGPNGFNQLAEFVSVAEGNTNGPERTVRYRVKPGGNAFVKGDEGAYALAIEPNRVADVNGNFLQAGAIPDATFTVTIPENLPNLRVDTPLTGKFPAAVVGGGKASGGTVRVSNSGVGDVKTTVTVSLFASPDAELDTAADTQVAVINGVKLSLKPGKGKALKLKFTQFPANLPDGDYFLIARLDGGDALPELKESDNNAATPTAINISAPFVDLSGTPAALGGALVPGGKANASVLIRNGGNIALKQTVPVGLFASPGDATPGNDDVNIATPSAKLNLKPGASKATKLSFTMPTTGLAPGTYTLLAVLDSTGVVGEKDETNNLVALGQFTIA